MELARRASRVEAKLRRTEGGLLVVNVVIKARPLICDVLLLRAAWGEAGGLAGRGRVLA
jgi:hypothetical protein